ncbi:MAG: hypothetical protein U0T83_04875 [Bacteriovoracaceae bacterium]
MAWALSHPLAPYAKIVTAEFAGNLSNGSGIGGQARFSYKLNPELTTDGGFGISTGDRSNTVFAPRIRNFPDFDQQPRFAIRGSIENGAGLKSRKTTLSLAPKASKGFTVNEKEIYPYVAIPTGIILDHSTNKYQPYANLSLGATANIPMEGYEKLIASTELNLSMVHNYSSIFVGLSYPIQ